MTAHRKTAPETVAALLELRPTLSSTQLGALVGVCGHRIRQILPTLGYRWQPRCWVKQ